MRGVEACEGEWSLVCAAHNLLKLFRYGTAAAAKKTQDCMMAVQTTDNLVVAA